MWKIIIIKFLYNWLRNKDLVLKVKRKLVFDVEFFPVLVTFKKIKSKLVFSDLLLLIC